MKRTILITLLALLLAPVATVSADEPVPTDAAEDWTSQKALDDIHALIHWKASRAELSKRRESVKAWLKKIEEHDMKLGDMEFVVGIAHYFAGNIRAANQTLVQILKKRGFFPKTDYDQHLGRVLLGTTGSAVTAKEFATVELTLPIVLQLTSNKKLVYHRIGGSLRRAHRVDAHRLLNWMVGHVLDQPDLDDTEKQQVLEGLYGRTNTVRSRTPKVSAAMSQVLGPRPLRPFTARDLDGELLSLSDYKGKVVLVDFWATWCGPCLLEMPNVVRVYKSHHEKGFEIIGISLDKPGTEPRLRSTMKRLGMSWRQIYDGKGWSASIALNNKVRRIPSTFLLDRTGKVRYTSLRGRALNEKVTELLAEEPPARSADAR